MKQANLNETEGRQRTSFQELSQRIGDDFVEADEEDHEYRTADKEQLNLAKEFVGIARRIGFRHERPPYVANSEKEAAATGRCCGGAYPSSPPLQQASARGIRDGRSRCFSAWVTKVANGERFRLFVSN